MRPIRVPVPAEGASAPVPLDIYQRGATLAIVSVEGTVDIELQYTLDDVFAPDFDPTTASWHTLQDTLGDLSGVGVRSLAAEAQVEGGEGSDLHATAVRAVNDGNGTAVLQVVQSGVMG